MSKTASALVAYCEAQLGRPYWFGTCGDIASAALFRAKKAQYPGYYTASDFPKQYGQKVHDCVGLIKGFRWSDSPDAQSKYNAAQDVAVSGLLGQCSKRGSIATMPDQPGVCVFMSEHVGVYVGGGYVIEARGHAYGVVKTKLKDRPWTKWGKPDWITYDTATGSGSTATRTADKSISVSGTQVALGSNGSAVRKLQILLAGLGYYKGSIDGDFGALTKAAVIAFQKDNGLEQDGIVGAKTWGALIR